MLKLTDTQLIVLTNAAAHSSGAADRPARLPPAAALKVSAALISRGLMREAPTRRGMPIWRTDGAGRALSLMLTSAGRAAVGVLEQTRSDEISAELQKPSSRLASAPGQPSRSERSQHGAATGHEPPNSSASASLARTGTKQDAVVSMLSNPAGATIDALMAHTGWLPHTTRAVLSGLRKRGHSIERVRDEEGRSRYRITGGGRSLAGA